MITAEDHACLAIISYQPCPGSRPGSAPWRPCLLAGQGPGLAEYLASVPDPRDPGGVRHTLTSLLLAAVAAVLAGARVPSGLIGLDVNHARRIVLDAGLTVRLTRRDGRTAGRHGLLGPGSWVVVHTVPQAGDHLSRGAEVVLQLAERGPRR
jgi:DDE_Tnp_1-associated